MVIDDGADLGIRGVDDDQSSLDPELFIDPPVLKKIVPEDLVELVPVGCLKDTRREVGVLAVLARESKR